MHSDAFRVYTVLVNQVSLANFGYENLLLHWGEKKGSLRVVEIRSCHSFPDVSQKSWTGGWRRVGLMVGSWSHGGSNGGNNWRIAMVRSNLEHALFEEVSLAEVAHFQILAFSCCFSCYVCSVLWLTWSLRFFFSSQAQSLVHCWRGGVLWRGLGGLNFLSAAFWGCFPFAFTKIRCHCS